MELIDFGNSALGVGLGVVVCIFVASIAISYVADNWTWLFLIFVGFAVGFFTYGVMSGVQNRQMTEAFEEHYHARIISGGSIATGQPGNTGTATFEVYFEDTGKITNCTITPDPAAGVLTGFCEDGRTL